MSRNKVRTFRSKEGDKIHLINLCQNCADLISVDDELELVGIAPLWVDCSDCDAQNLPEQKPERAKI